MRKSFFKHTVILTLTSQLLRTVGIFFIAYLSGKIGAEGIGLYQLIISIYILAATLVTSGIGIAVTRLTAEAIGKSGYKSTSNVLQKCIALSLALGVSVAVILFFSADFLGSTVINDVRAIPSLKILAPALPFMAVSSCFRGYFYGVRKPLKPASEMILEQFVSILIIVAVINFFLPKGLEYTCFVIMLSMTTAEVLSFFYSFILYRVDRAKSKLAVVKDGKIWRRIRSIFFPVAGSSYLRAGLRTAENVLIPYGLKAFRRSNQAALSQYGLLIGMVMPLLTFPAAFLTAVATLLLPEISEANALHDREKVKSTVAKVFRLTLLLSLLFCGLFVFFGKELGLAVYQSAEAGSLLMLLSPLVPLIYLDFLVDSMLNALNQQMITLKINVLDYTLRIGLILVFIPKFGLLAYIAILYFSILLNASFSIHRLIRASSIKVDVPAWVIKPFLSIMAAGSVVLLIFHFLPALFSPALALTFKIAVAAGLYIAFLFMIGCLSRKDVVWFKRLIKDRPAKAEEAGMMDETVMQ